jgi:threonine/homoserine efflux transporter RhtA
MTTMNLQSVPVEPIVALVAGIVILVQPGLLNYIVAVYLIVIGVIGLAPRLFS